MALGDVLKNLGASVGVGAATVAVALEMQPQAVGRGGFSYGPYSYGVGESVAGRIMVTGGVVAQQISEVEVRATEHWTTTDGKGVTSHHYNHHNASEIARGVTLAPDQVFESEFLISLPLSGNLTHDWAITVGLGIAHAADASGSAPLELLPPVYAQGLDACLLAAVPFTQNGISYSSDGGLELDYAPPAHLERELDGVKLLVEPPAANADAVTATLEINPQEKSFADRIKALTRADLVRHPLTFTRTLLESASPLQTAEPSPEVVAYLRALLAPYQGAAR